MDTYEYISIDHPGVHDTYILHADVERCSDGSWSAWARAYLRMRLEFGGVPGNIKKAQEPVVAVTL